MIILNFSFVYTWILSNILTSEIDSTSLYTFITIFKTKKRVSSSSAMKASGLGTLTGPTMRLNCPLTGRPAPFREMRVLFYKDACEKGLPLRWLTADDGWQTERYAAAAKRCVCACVPTN